MNETKYKITYIDEKTGSPKLEFSFEHSDNLKTMLTKISNDTSAKDQITGTIAVVFPIDQPTHRTLDQSKMNAFITAATKTQFERTAK